MQYENIWNVFTYPAEVVYIYDGDTFRLNIDLGFHRWFKNVKVRIAFINAPEIKGASRPNGLRARDYARELLAGKELRVRAIQPDPGKYGRYIVQLWFWHSVYEEWADYAETLFKAGHAERYP